jgi:hypothetical protein
MTSELDGLVNSCVDFVVFGPLISNVPFGLRSDAFKILPSPAGIVVHALVGTGDADRDPLVVSQRITKSILQPASPNGIASMSFTL